MDAQKGTAKLCIIIAVSLALPKIADAQLHDDPDLLGSYASDDGNGRRLTNEYRLKQGDQLLRGLVVEPRKNRNLQSVEVFLGLPYAAPPVGSLRFMPPGNALRWNGVKIATTFAPVCPQMLPDLKKEAAPSAGRYNYMKRLIPFLRNQSEDCLYLNIYAPSEGDYTTPTRKPKKYPVLVFIHGESYEWNSGNPYDGTVLASYGKIIIVTINFRLGILGFMKPSISEHSIGNFGLLDQIAALQWVKDNIETFNGDADAVTLMGHGTGAACVNFLMVSPVANGLFHRAVLMSGSALSDWALTNNPQQYTFQAAQSLNCPLTSESDLGECLRKKRLSEIMAVRVSAPKYTTTFGPIIDGSVIPNEPAQVMGVYKDLFSKYELMYGCTELESYHLLNAVALAHGMLESERNSALRLYIHTRFEVLPELVFASTIKEYTSFQYDPLRSTAESHRDAVLDILSDARVAAPIIQTANYHSKANRGSYFYIFGHNSQAGEYAAVPKSVHGEELAYIFGIPLEGARNHFRTEYSQQEKLLSEAIMTLWANFVKTGNPNHQRMGKQTFHSLGPKEWKQYDVGWPPYDQYNQSYFHIGIPPYVSSHYRGRYMRFWNEILPSTLKNVTTITYETPVFAKKTTVKPHIIFDETKWQDTPKPKPQMNFNNWYKPPSPTSNSFGRFNSYPEPLRPTQEDPYAALKTMDRPQRPVPPGLMDGPSRKWGITPPTLLRAITPDSTSEPEKDNKTEVPIKTSSLTINLIIAVGSIFLLVNILAFAILYYKKSRLKSRERDLKRNNLNNGGDEDIAVVNKSVMHSSSDGKGCNMMNLLAISSNKKSDDIYEPVKNQYIDNNCKTPKSDDSGGFGRRFRLQRHLSNSTLDAHTKVRDWIAQEIVRFSPKLDRKDNLKDDIANVGRIPRNECNDYVEGAEGGNKVASLSRSHQTGTDSTISIGGNANRACSRHPSSKCSSARTQVTKIGKEPLYAQLNKRNNSNLCTSKTCEETKMSNKVSVAVDATPSARGSSVLRQQPIELSKSLDMCCCNDEVDGALDSLRRSKTMEEFVCRNSRDDIENPHENIYKSSINFQLAPIVKDFTPEVIKIVHKHSTSDPVHDVQYTEMFPIGMVPKNQRPLNTFNSVQPPVAFRNDINVTTQEEFNKIPLTPEESLMTIKRRNFPKVLPDFPNKFKVPGHTQKRLSLPPQSFMKVTPDIITTFSSNSRPEVSTLPRSPPPLPPPRTTSTLDRKFNSQTPIPSCSVEPEYRLPRLIPSFTKHNDFNKIHRLPVVNMIEIENDIRSLTNSNASLHDQNSSSLSTTTNSSMETIRVPPSVIISANSSRLKHVNEPKIIIKASAINTPHIQPRNCAHVIVSDSEEETTTSNDNLSRSLSNDSREEEITEAKLIRNLIGLSYDQDLSQSMLPPLTAKSVPDTKGPPTVAEMKVDVKKACSKTNDNIPSAHNAMQFPVMFQNEHLGNVSANGKTKKESTKSSKLPKTPIMVAKNKNNENPKGSKNLPKTSFIPQLVPINTEKEKTTKENLSESSNDTEDSMETVKKIK